MKATQIRRFMLVCVPLVLLAGCKPLDWFKEKFGTNKPAMKTTIAADTQKAEAMPGAPASDERVVLVTMNGKPVLYVDDLERSLTALMQTQPALGQMLPFMQPEQRKQLIENIVNALVDELVVAEWIEAEGIDKTEDYQKNLAEVIQAVKRDLAVRTLQNEVLKTVSVSDSDAQRYYDRNKKEQAFQRYPFIEKPEAVEVIGISFDDQKSADNMLASAKKARSLRKPAKDKDLSVKEWGMVTMQTPDVDYPIKAEVFGYKSFPSFGVVQSGDKFWVVCGVKKRDAQFAAFDSVKDAVKQMALQEKFRDAYKNRVKKVRSGYRVSIDNKAVDAFDQKLAPVMPEVPAEAAAPQKSSPRTA